jgi:hypothetical protein
VTTNAIYPFSPLFRNFWTSRTPFLKHFFSWAEKLKQAKLIKCIEEEMFPQMLFSLFSQLLAAESQPPGM